MLDFDWTMKADSDHHPFFAAGVPVVMLHTGLHDDYHRPSDKAEKINSGGLRLVSQLMFRTALDLADEDTRPKFRTAAQSESPSEQSNAERLEPTGAGPARFELGRSESERWRDPIDFRHLGKRRGQSRFESGGSDCQLCRPQVGRCRAISPASDGHPRHGVGGSRAKRERRTH